MFIFYLVLYKIVIGGKLLVYKLEMLDGIVVKWCKFFRGDKSNDFLRLF